jgi:hypothetical protein
LTIQAKVSAAAYSEDWIPVHLNVDILISLDLVISPSGWWDQLRIQDEQHCRPATPQRHHRAAPSSMPATRQQESRLSDRTNEKANITSLCAFVPMVGRDILLSVCRTQDARPGNPVVPSWHKLEIQARA